MIENYAIDVLEELDELTIRTKELQAEKQAIDLEIASIKQAKWYKTKDLVKEIVQAERLDLLKVNLTKLRRIKRYKTFTRAYEVVGYSSDTNEELTTHVQVAKNGSTRVLKK